MELPCRFRLAIVGPSCERILALSHQYGVNIKFPAFSPQCEFEEVEVVGPDSICWATTNELRKRTGELLAEEEERLRDLPILCETIQVSREYHCHFSPIVQKYLQFIILQVWLILYLHMYLGY